MSFNDTSLLSGENLFPETTQGLRSQLAGGTEPEIRRGLETFCRRYWRAVYGFLRIAWAKSNEDAKDLTQAFFLWLLEGNALGHYSADRASLRRYVKLLLRRFVINQEEASKRLKRGGSLHRHGLDRNAEVASEVQADSRLHEPERAFDAIWRGEVVRRAVLRLEERCKTEHRSEDFLLFKDFVLAEHSDRPTYATLAARAGRTERQVEHCLTTLKADLRTEILNEVSCYSAGSVEDREEALLGT